jgi:hypothetical protein
MLDQWVLNAAAAAASLVHCTARYSAATLMEARLHSATTHIVFVYEPATIRRHMTDLNGGCQ